ncbi:ATP-binding protein [Candidatus Pacearchaeota archaeon]|nr:ATP-binding protein [Candidatus Pacearchaeota archaeon]
MERVKLEEFNHWWIEKKVDPELALPFKRESFLEIEKNVHKKFITAIVGLRRVGKTTIIYQIIDKLIKEKIEATNLLFFSFDEVSAKLIEVIEAYKEIHKKNFREEKIYIFLDEIQKCENWENQLKKYYDLYPKLKFVISGSESLFIRKKTKETLAGRMFEFSLYPFNFKEFLKFKGVTENEFKYESRIKPFFIEYIQKGGFPETFSIKSERESKEYIRSIIIDKIVYKDIPFVFKLDDPRFVSILLEIISSNPGMYIDYQSLSKKLGRDRRVIKNYISYIQESFLIRLLGNYRHGSMTTLRKMKRAYPTDNSFINLFSPKIDENLFGRMVETAVINKLHAISFWKNGNEIDVIHDNIPLEVKYQEKINLSDYKSLLEFMKKFKVKKATLITKKEEKDVKVEEGIIKLIPAWKWFLMD